MTFVTLECMRARVWLLPSLRSVGACVWPWLPERVVVVHIPCVLTRCILPEVREFIKDTRPKTNTTLSPTAAFPRRLSMLHPPHSEPRGPTLLLLLLRLWVPYPYITPMFERVGADPH